MKDIWLPFQGTVGLYFCLRVQGPQGWFSYVMKNHSSRKPQIFYRGCFFETL